MDYSVKEFEYVPGHFIAGSTIGTVAKVKTAAADVKAHAPVVIADGKIKPLAAGAEGKVDTAGIYGITAQAGATGTDVPVLLTGEFFADALALEAGVTAADIEVALRGIGIFLV